MGEGEPGYGELVFSPTRISDIAHDLVADEIVRGDLPDGYRIRYAEIAERLGVSRMPVREAIMRLEYEGLIESSVSRYTRVTRVDAESAEAIWAWLARELAFGLALASTRATRGEKSAIATALRRVSTALGGRDAGDVAARAVILMDVVVECASNVQLSKVWRDERNACRRALQRASFAEMPPMVRDHEAESLIAALDAGDAARVEVHARRLLR
ncbi:GntR family transcriptional regulator [Microbacterium gilvum]|uniref:GntR family transcriptional regulator n=1 Tax=Microbacterium gilvum TaxID=1336204 RepID=A0ABP9A0D1_9MICO